MFASPFESPDDSRRATKTEASREEPSMASLQQIAVCLSGVRRALRWALLGSANEQGVSVVGTEM
jgi:hypothetical protein